MPAHPPLIKTFLELLAIDSESFNERRVADYLISRLRPLADSFIEDDAAVKLNGNAGNLIFSFKGTRTGLPTVMLNAHMDTVKPGNGVQPVFDGDIIRSSGKTILGGDDKAGVSVILEIIRRLKEENIPHGDLLVVLTAAEEIGIRGASVLNPKHLKADFGYTLDCTGQAGGIYVASPTHDKLTATVTGLAAHAGIEPEKGISAIRIASNAISRMNLGRIDDETTANVGVIRGGRATNIIPDSVTIEAEARSHNTAKLDAQIAHMRDALETAAAEAGAGISIKIEREYLNYRLPENAPVVRVAQAAARAIGIQPTIRVSGGGSDANIFNAHGLPTAPLGTAMRNCHSLTEEISVSELQDVFRFVMQIVMNPVAE